MLLRALIVACPKSLRYSPMFYLFLLSHLDYIPYGTDFSALRLEGV